MTEEEAVLFAESVPDWDLRLGAVSITRQLRFADFAATMAFVNAVANLAEAEGHHPDIAINYNRLALSLSTHAAGGLTENDFILAAKIDALPAD